MPTSKLNNKPVGITLGDPAGIGPEITAKALNKPSVRKLGKFVVIGDSRSFKRFFKTKYKNCEFIAIDAGNKGKWSSGKPSRASGAIALKSLECSVKLLKAKKISALVTAPVSKVIICQTAASFQGHTEFLAGKFKATEVGMMFVSPQLRTILATRHLALNKVSRRITAKLVYKTLLIANRALRELFKIRSPKIAVCGLNPHAGEGGTIGLEEITKIIPAIKRAKRNGISAFGPFAADTLFVPHNASRYDIIIAIYHDQGLIAVKSMYFQQLVNLTVGLPFIRTAPAHGTAFDIAGRNKADASSMAAAIRLAADLSR